MIRTNDNGVKYCDVCNCAHSFPYLDENGECKYCFNIKKSSKNNEKKVDYEIVEGLLQVIHKRDLYINDLIQRLPEELRTQKEKDKMLINHIFKED